MPKLTILFSGKKSSGKTSAGKYALAYYLNKQIKNERFLVQSKEKDVFLLDTYTNKRFYPDIPGEFTSALLETHRVKMYSFADTLKDICINILGLNIMQCYGTDEDKNSLTNIEWSSISEEIIQSYYGVDKNSKPIRPTGCLTSRQVMEILGTSILRKMDENCWSRGLYNKIQSDNIDFAIICDGRFPNEISMGSERGVYPFRLLRNIFNSQTKSECALDNFPLGEYYSIIDNKDISIEQTQLIIKSKLDTLFQQHGLF